MKNIHTFQAARSNGRTEAQTRTSDSRRYEACLVSTVTARSVELALARKAKLEADLAKATSELKGWCKKLGMTVQEAQTYGEAASAKWHDQWFDAADEVRRELNRPHAHRSEIEGHVATLLESRGLVNPYAAGGPHEIVHLQNVVSGLAQNLAGWSEPVVGLENVLSWHLTVGNAQKALQSGREANWARELGHSVAIRTDFTVVSK